MYKRQINAKSDIVFNIVAYSIAIVSLVIIIYPLYYILIASVSEPSAVTNGRMWLWPVGFNVDGYVALLKDSKIWIAYGNTIFYALGGTLIALVVNVPAAYALSRKDLVFRKPLMTYYLIVMFFSGGLIPTYLTVRDFGLYNTRWVLIVPFCVSIYNIIVARTFFSSSLPEDLWDAARIDGSGNTRFFFTMVLPLSKAILSVLALWTAVGYWNAYYNALIYLSRAELLPLQVVLRQILIQHIALEAFGTGEAASIAMRQANLVRYAAIIVSTLPIMCFYPFVQKHFNQGVMLGAVKG
jgi:putative aldouronate transport system permease protein